MSDRPRVSVILATHNRRDVLMTTLHAVADCGLDGRDLEIIVVDNASTDGTADLVSNLPHVRLVRLRRNMGSCAKAAGVETARGLTVVFLDDDSSPRPGCLERMIRHFEDDRRLGAAAFTVHLPDGSQECSALPHVFVGCGVGFRGRALRSVGGLDPTFFMQAEEYDLSFRLLGAGWNIETFADLQVDHLKTPHARKTRRTTYYDVRNNLRVIARYLPPPFRSIYQQDWLQRYRWLAQHDGHLSAFRRGVAGGRMRSLLERRRFRGQRLSASTLEQVFGWSFVRTEMERLFHNGLRRIVLADVGKNIFAFYRGACEAGLTIRAVADDRFAANGRVYRGIPIVNTEKAISLGPDAYVVGNTSYVHAEQRFRELTNRTSRPVYNWFRPPQREPVGEIGSRASAAVSDLLPSSARNQADVSLEPSLLEPRLLERDSQLVPIEPADPCT